MLEADLAKMDHRLPNNVPTPLSSGYRPELDVSVILDDDFTNWYQWLIGILSWAVELGRCDIHFSVAVLAQYLAQPRASHLEQVFHLFAYLKAHMRSRIILDNSKPVVDESHFMKTDWEAFYPVAKEAIHQMLLNPEELVFSSLALWMQTMLAIMSHGDHILVSLFSVIVPRLHGSPSVRILLKHPPLGRSLLLHE